MITKVGHARPMLICTDCGLPVDQRESIAMARQRFWGALTLMGMALISGAMLLLATIYEYRMAGSMEGSLDRPEDGSEKEGKKDETRILLEPSGLVKPASREPASGETPRFSGTKPGSDAREGQAAPTPKAPGPSEAADR
jgi:hypothetical protein